MGRYAGEEGLYKTSLRCWRGHCTSNASSRGGLVLVPPSLARRNWLANVPLPTGFHYLVTRWTSNVYLDDDDAFSNLRFALKKSRYSFSTCRMNIDYLLHISSKKNRMFILIRQFITVNIINALLKY